MKINWNNKYLTVTVYALIGVALSILIYNILQGFSEDYSFIFDSIYAIFKPIAYGVVIAYILCPFEKFFEYKALPKIMKKGKPKGIRRMSIALTYLVFVIVLTLILYVAIPQLFDSVNKVADSFPMYIRNIQNWFNDITKTKTGAFIAQNFNLSSVNFESLFSGFHDMLNSSIVAVKSTVSAFITFLFNMIVGITISIYLLIDRENYFRQLRKLLFAYGNKEKMKKFCTGCTNTKDLFNNFIYGKIVECFIVGLACYIGVLIMGVNNALLISFIVGVTNFIPYFGPIIGAVPGIVLIFFDGTNGTNPTMALIFAVFILILQQLDGNVLGPRILGKSVGISSFWVLISVVVFGQFFGVWGMLLSVPIFAVITSAFKVYVNNRLELRQVTEEDLSNN